MRFGEYPATGSNAVVGVATCTTSTPIRYAARPTNAGAPVNGPPPTTRSRPFCPLWESGRGTG